MTIENRIMKAGYILAFIFAQKPTLKTAQAAIKKGKSKAYWIKRAGSKKFIQL